MKNYLIILWILIIAVLSDNALFTESIDMFGLNVFLIDILSVIVFGKIMMSQFSGNPVRKAFYRKTSIMFLMLTLGMVPVLVGIFYGKSNVFYMYRFFFFSCWFTYIFSHMRRSYLISIYTLRSILLINGAVLFYLIMVHIFSVGLSIAYLTNFYDLNIFCFFVIAVSKLFSVRIFKSEIMLNALLMIELASILLDPSRRVPLAVLATFVLFVYSCYRWRNKFSFKKILLGKLVIVLFGFIIISSLFSDYYLSNIVERFQKALQVTHVISADAIVGASLLHKVADDSVAVRFLALKIATELISENPLLGIGSGDRVQWESRITQAQQDAGVVGLGGLNPHSFYIQMLMLYGVPLTLISIYLIIKELTYYKVAFGHIKDRSLLNKVKLSYIVRFGVIGYMVGILFSSFMLTTIVMIWVLLGVSAGFSNNIKINENPV